MKYLITTIAAVVLVGCGPSRDTKLNLIMAAEQGNVEYTLNLLTNGVPVNSMVEDGGEELTALMSASKWGHKEVADLLIALGADINIGKPTPLQNAAKWGHKGIVELLIISGANLNKQNKAGLTPLDLAELEYDEKANEYFTAKFGKHVDEIRADLKETADLLRKHGAKTGEELKAERK